MRPTPDKNRPGDHVVACRPSGYTREISELANLMFVELRGRGAKQKKHEPTDVAWAGQDPATHHHRIVATGNDGPFPVWTNLHEQGIQLENIQARLLNTLSR